jgi:hypothetical protein
VPPPALCRNAPPENGHLPAPLALLLVLLLSIMQLDLFVLLEGQKWQNVQFGRLFLRTKDELGADVGMPNCARESRFN